MPGLDRRGPFGNGSKTGRGLGKCSDNSEFARLERDRPRYGRCRHKTCRGRHGNKTDVREN
ncbi:DUF5320 domain-containing protein [Flexistipes sinusarabici]|uniref:Uncharacterized protein n=1 Tax=Flexistipes sinusarabici TaxID=2352 RepID=A0A3D5QB64_FLESI|nr:DUF5320 domain-containing protein [Flexistipes sinusarabici]HCW92529.1 hypothetical protein [Flexistipes sinusarabici]